MRNIRGRIPLKRPHLVALFVLFTFLLTGTLMVERMLGRESMTEVLGVQSEE